MKTANRKNLPDFFDFGPYKFDTRDHLLFKQGKEIHLTPKVAEILLALLTRHGHVVEKEELMHEVWANTIVEENNLTRNISTLRKTLNAESEEDEYIETIPRRGYRFVAEVREVNESLPPVEHAEPVSNFPGTEVEPVHQTSPDTISVTSQPGISAPVIEKKAQESVGQENAKAKPMSAFNFVRPRRLFYVLLLVIIATLIPWQIRSFYCSSKSPEQDVAAEVFSRLRLDRHPAKGIPQVAELSPDGKYIAYAAGDEFGQQSLYLSLVNSNDAKRLVPFSDTKYLGLNFAPDGTHLYFTRLEEHQNNVLYRLGMLSDELPQKMATLGSVSPVKISPNGARMAFIRESAEEGITALITANLDGSAESKLIERKLPEFFSLTASPSWSPDGKTLACVVGTLTSGVRYQVATVSAETSHELRLNPYPTQWPWIYQVAWLPNGLDMLLLADKQPGGWRDQLWLMTWPEGNLKRLTNDLNDYSGISVAADSSSLITVQSTQLSDIWIVPYQSGERSQRITSFNEQREGLRGLDWTSDGHLLFSAVNGGRDHIWSMHPDGSQRCEVTSHESADSNNHSPHSSPDGRYIVFVSDRQGKMRIWRANLDGSQQLPLTEGHDDFNPQVSADGQWVVYSSAKSGSRTLWKVPLAGGAEVQVTEWFAETPVASPISNLIACTRRESGMFQQRNQAIIDLDSRQPTLWTTIPDAATWIRWMPNGKALSYQIPLNGVANLWSQPLNGKPPTRITDLSFENIASYAWSRDGKRLALVRVQEIRSVVFINGLK